MGWDGRNFGISQLMSSGMEGRSIYLLSLFVAVLDERAQFFWYLFFSGHSLLRMGDFLDA